SLDGDCFGLISVGLSCFNLSRHRSATAHLGALLAQHCFARQLDTITLEGEYLYEHLIAFLQFVANVFHAMLGDLADVQQTIGSREDLYEGSEFSQTHDLAEVCLANFGNSGDVADHLKSLTEGGFIG